MPKHAAPRRRKIRRRLGFSATAIGGMAALAGAMVVPAAVGAHDGCNLTVFVARDFDGSGVYDAGIDVPQRDMTVTITDAEGRSFTHPTGPNGTVTLDPIDAGLSGTLFRVRVSVPDFNDQDGVPYSSYLQPAPASTEPGGFAASPSVVDLADGTDRTVTMGVWDPTDWAPANPKMAVAMHSALPVPPLPGAVSTFNFNDRIIDQATLLSSSLGTQGQLGTIGGMAYQPAGKRLLAGALAKAQTPYGKGGPGAIYAIPQDKSQQPTLFTTVPNAGSTTHAATYPVADPAFFRVVGKEGLGDLQLSPDQRSLYVVNLNTRELLTYDATQPTAAAPRRTVAIPNPGCAADGDWRPYALSVHNGQLYVGGVCTGESAIPAIPIPVTTDLNARAKMSAVVYRVDRGGFTKVFTHSLDFARGQTVSSLGTRPDVATHWNAWDSNLLHVPVQWSAAPALSRPQPILSDIAWDRDGSMILGFRDRGGDQMAASPGIYTSAGDINRACSNGDGTFTWEGEGDCPNNNSLLLGGPQLPSLPGFQMPKEYFPGDWFAGVHMETAQGSLAYPLQQKKIASTNMDPNMLLSSGIGWYDSKTGAGPGTDPTGSGLLLSTVVTNGIGKANALGGIAVMADNAGQQIGDKVWYDRNGDGLQGVDEPGVRKATVRLRDLQNNVLATTTTNDAGQYYFGNAASGLVKPSTTYIVEFDACTADTSPIAGAPPGASLHFTQPNVPGDDGLNSKVEGASDCHGQTVVTTPDSPGAVVHNVDAGVV